MNDTIVTTETDVKPTLLIVDDEPKNHRAYERILEPLNIRIIQVMSGQEALAQAWLHDFFLILMDVQMPGMDGFETASLILDHPKTAHIPIIFITALTKNEAFEFKGYQSGAVDYMTKPIDDAILINKVKIFIDLYQEKKLLKTTLEEHEKSENQLRLLRNYLSNIINSMPSILIGIDPDLNVTHWNAEAERFCVLKANDAVGKPLETAFPLLNDEREYITASIETGDSYLCSKETTRDEEKIYQEITVFPLLDDETRGAVIRIDDVTEKKRIKELITQAEKMQSVGGLAAGMAHEINNPLTAIVQGYQNMTRRLDPSREKNIAKAQEFGIDLGQLQKFLESHKISSLIDGGIQAVERAAEIVKKLLKFSRKQGSNLQEISICMLIEQIIENTLSTSADDKEIALNREYDSHIAVISCCKSEIRQAITDIIKNSQEAMSRISDSSYEPQLTIRLKHHPKEVFLEIEDNGPGIPEKNLQRIFEPFFTTKPIGNGTGLGLSTAYMIITQNHNGTLEIASKLGKGTTVTIHLPL